MLDLSKTRYVPLTERLSGAIETGFLDYDKHIFDLKPGEITILFGRNGEGKSTVASQMLAHHVSRNRKAYLYSGELSENKIQEWFYKQIIGADAKYYDIVKTKYGRKTDFKPNIISMVKEWSADKLYIYNMKLDKISKDSEKLFMDMTTAKTLGCDLFVIDNLMTAYEINERTQYADQANFVQNCKNFATNNNVHIIIIAHPNKAQGELNHESTIGNLTKNDVSGTGNIPNKADNILAVERIWKVKNAEYDQSVPDAYITSLKDREDGVRAVFRYWFSKHSLRFYNNNTPQFVDYDWKNEGIQSGFTADDNAPF